MRYLYTLLLFLAVHAAQAQVQLISLAARLAATAAVNAARGAKAAKNDTATIAVVPAVPAAAVAPTPITRYITPFTYRGESVSRQRTAAAQLKGKGTAEILALEASLEESYKALTAADSVQSFLPAAQYTAIIAAARKAAAARTTWDYSPYQQELAFYQREEARRQQARDTQVNQPAPTN